MSRFQTVLLAVIALSLVRPDVVCLWQRFEPSARAADPAVVCTTWTFLNQAEGGDSGTKDLGINVTAHTQFVNDWLENQAVKGYTRPVYQNTFQSYGTGVFTGGQSPWPRGQVGVVCLGR